MRLPLTKTNTHVASGVIEINSVKCIKKHKLKHRRIMQNLQKGTRKKKRSFFRVQ